MKSLDFHEEFVTCNALDYFNTQVEQDNDTDERIIEGTLAAEPTLLIANEMFSLEGTLARWSTYVEGTYFTSVCIKSVDQTFLMQVFFLFNHSCMSQG